MGACLADDEAVFADGAFSARTYAIPPIEDDFYPAEQVQNLIQASFRISIERSFRRFKSFTAWKTAWRHDLEKIDMAGQATFQALNVDFIARPPYRDMNVLLHFLGQ
jgi:hypothetical protein